jgi:hypothetical protein
VKLTEVSAWLDANQLLTFSLLIPFISFVVAIVSSQFAVRRALNSEKVQRYFEVTAQIAAFRQQWIDALRDDLSEFAGITAIAYTGAAPIDKVERMSILAMRIQMRMNAGDPDYDAMHETLMRTSEQFLFGGPQSDMKVKPLVSLSQQILKREWERLKQDLKSNASG